MRILDKIIWYFIIGTLFLGFIYGLYCLSTGKSPRDNYNPTFKHQKMVVVDTPTVELVKNEILRLNIKYPEIVLAQSVLETGWFKSRRCLEDHNLFGFRTKKGYKLYESWESSVFSYKTWQIKYYRGEEDYYEFLTNIGYFEDSTYNIKLKQLVAQLK
jgi:flagellum-specific peptidoglycan hydrolase FlgJ